MSFELGLLMGLGRAAVRERDERSQKEKLQREQMEESNRRSLGMLEKLVSSDDLLPDDARNVAAQHLFRLATNPKAKDKDFTSAMQEVLMATNRPRSTPQTIAADSTRKIAAQDYSFLDTIAPGMGQATNAAMQQAPAYLPPPEMVSGVLTPQERSQREESQMRRRLEMQRDLSGSAPKASVVEGPDGVYRFGPDGNELGFTPFRTPTAPRQDFSRTPFEVWIDPNATPEQKAMAREAMTMQYTNQGDQVRAGAAGGGGRAGDPLASARFVETPNGPALIFPKLMNPDAQGMVPLPTGVQTMSDATKNTRAQTQGTIDLLDGMLQQFNTGTVDPKDVFGKGASIEYWARSSGWIPGMDAPDPAISNIRTDIANINNELTKLRSGAAVSAQEFSRLQREIPQPNMNPDEVVQRIRRMRERLARIFELRYGSNGVGDANAFPGDVEGAQPTRTASPRPNAPTPATPATSAAPAAVPGRLPAPPPPAGFQPIR